MNSYTSRDFWQKYRRLPVSIRQLARKSYRLWCENPNHPSLHFKKVGQHTWSARIGRDYRVLAAPVVDGYVWFWIGRHAEYERLIASLPR